MVLSPACSGQKSVKAPLKFIDEKDILVGAQRTEAYFPLIENKNIGLVANHTSLIGKVHLADSLIAAGFQLVKIFGPEHGFRGNQEAGREILDGKDIRTGIPVISLYGNYKKPSQVDLQDIDVIIFDIQDVGVRFYTYISTMAYVMEACAENRIPLIILDRPNPNGFYVDGPVLDTAFRSFVGLHPVPLVHGMTTGEYALMLNGEGWLANGVHCQLTVITVEGYDHSMLYRLPVKPSPNLPDWKSVYLYPSLGLFEGTIMSVGRGTETPFQVIGHPDFKIGSYVFTPQSLPGISDHPPYEGQLCFGQNLANNAENLAQNEYHFTLGFLISSYQYFKDSTPFFNDYFPKLTGSEMLKEQVMGGMDEISIRESWKEELDLFIKIRSKYLLYNDF
jgi:uncharacterized protein YbbC (DUF1343 family)